MDEPDLSNRVGDAGERFVPGDTHGELIETEHLARYWWVSPLADGARVLDAGCGVGYGTAMLARAGAAEAVGVDISAEAVRAAADGAPEIASFREADLRSLPFDDASFDLVVCFEVIEHVAEQDTVIAELARVLAPGGVLAISSPNRNMYPEGNPHHIHEYVPDELRAALERCFAEVALCRQHDWTTSAVLDDDRAADDSLTALAGVRIGKTFGQAPGTEPYTIALAGHGALPAVPGSAVLGRAAEIREWLGEISSLQDDNGRQKQLIAALTAERDRAREDVEALRSIEAQLREGHGVLVKYQDVLRADQDVLHAELEQLRASLREVHASLPWRAATLARRAGSRLRLRP